MTPPRAMGWLQKNWTSLRWFITCRNKAVSVFSFFNQCFTATLSYFIAIWPCLSCPLAMSSFWNTCMQMKSLETVPQTGNDALMPVNCSTSIPRIQHHLLRSAECSELTKQAFEGISNSSWSRKRGMVWMVPHNSSSDGTWMDCQRNRRVIFGKSSNISMRLPVSGISTSNEW
jgi:hypothetical protein